MASERILIVDDDEEMVNLVSGALTRRGYDVVDAMTGAEARSALGRTKPDLIVLDVMLPDASGRELCAEWSSDPATEGIPVILLTAQDSEDEVVDGFKCGATDYITKPFSSKILAARVEAILARREVSPTGKRIELEGLTIDPGRHEVFVEGELVSLTLTEFKMLSLLAGRPGWVFDRYQIVDAVHGHEHVVTDRSVDVQIGVLRKKLGDHGKKIETVWGVGYKYHDDSVDA